MNKYTFTLFLLTLLNFQISYGVQCISLLTNGSSRSSLENISIDLSMVEVEYTSMESSPLGDLFFYQHDRHAHKPQQLKVFRTDTKEEIRIFSNKEKFLEKNYVTLDFLPSKDQKALLLVKVSTRNIFIKSENTRTLIIDPHSIDPQTGLAKVIYRTDKDISAKDYISGPNDTLAIEYGYINSKGKKEYAIDIININTGKILNSLLSHKYLAPFQLSPSGRYILFRNQEREVEVSSIYKNQTHVETKNHPSSKQLSPDQLKTLNTKVNQIITRDNSWAVPKIKFDKNENYMLIDTIVSLNVINLKTLEIDFYTKRRPKKHLTSMITSDSDLIYFKENGDLVIKNLKKAKLKKSKTKKVGHQNKSKFDRSPWMGSTVQFLLSPNEKTMIYPNRMDEVVIVNVKTGKETKYSSPNRIEGLKFMDEKTIFITTEADRGIRYDLLNTQGKLLTKKFNIIGDYGLFYSGQINSGKKKYLWYIDETDTLRIVDVSSALGDKKQ